MHARVVITGATGFAGSHLLDLLAGDGAEVWAFHRAEGTRRRYANGQRQHVTWETVDVLDDMRLRALLAAIRPTALYHCAGAAQVAASWADSTTPLEVNVRGTHNVLEGLRQAGVTCRVLMPGSATVYRASDRAIGEDDPVAATSPYGFSKLAQEMLASRVAASDGQPVLLARAFNHIGPRQDPSYAASSFARQIARIEAGLEEPIIEVGNLEARRDITDVRDTVRAYRLIMERGVPGRVYNVCSGHAPTMRELLERLVAYARAGVTVRHDPARMRPSDSPVLLGRPDRLQQELGWMPEIPLNQTLLDLLDYWRARTAERAVD